MPRRRRGSIRRCRRPPATGRQAEGRYRARAGRSVTVAWPWTQGREAVGQNPRVAKLHFGPARVPSRDSPAKAISLLKRRGFTACEIDFEGGFWMDYPWASRFVELARQAGIVLSVHAPIAGFMGHVERDKKQRMAVGMLDHSAGIAKAAGAELVVFHPGFLLGRTRAAAIKSICEQLSELRERLAGKDRAAPLGVAGRGGRCPSAWRWWAAGARAARWRTWSRSQAAAAGYGRCSTSRTCTRRATGPTSTSSRSPPRSRPPTRSSNRKRPSTSTSPTSPTRTGTRRSTFPTARARSERIRCAR